MISVEIKGLTKRFSGAGGEDLLALDRLDLSVRSGEYLVVVGPSGGGKTTLLRLIAGLDTPDFGETTFWEAGLRIEAAAENLCSRIEVAMVFQDSALYPHLTVRGNLELGLKVRRVESLERQRRIEDVGLACGIERDWWQRMPSELSGGEKRRIALARALVRRPQLLLLDEPLSNLDAPARFELRELLRRLPGRDAMTLIHVTHDQAEALSLGQRMAVLNKGRLQQIGTPREVYRKPANLFVARFLGRSPMNIVEGRIVIEGCGTRWFVQNSGIDGFKVRLPARVGSGGSDPAGSGYTGPVLLGVRPDSALRVDAGDLREDPLSGRVGSIDYFGSETVMEVTSAGVRWLVSWASSSNEFTVGESLNFRIDWNEVSWFDTETGQRLNLNRGAEVTEVPMP